MTTDLKLDWNRYWCKRNGLLVFGQDGFLIVPDAHTGHRSQQSHLFRFDEIANHRCLVFLGEPGIGKSRELQRQFERTAAVDHVSLHRRVDLRVVVDAYSLDRQIFNTSWFSAWAEGRQPLTLWLDSLDEAAWHWHKVWEMLIGEFQTIPSDRLSVRVACRTAIWPSTFERDLKALWQDQVGVYELAPLDRNALQLAAAVTGVSTTDFISEVQRLRVQALASSPLTLLMLLQEFRSEGSFSSSQFELYENALLRLCDEPDKRRMRPGLKGTLAPEQRFVVAGRIAAMMLLGRFSVVSVARDSSEGQAGELQLQEILGGEESWNGSTFSVTLDHVLEVLDTGLFTARGETLMGWAHQTYSDFLGAGYIHAHALAFAQRRSLVTLPDDPQTHIVPQLTGLVAWLATQDSAIFDHVLKRAPELLLQSDVAKLDDAGKQAVVGRVLERFDQQELVDSSNLKLWREHRLAHPKLAEQLMPYLDDRSRSMLARRAAIQIARGCSVKDLGERLLAIVLDESEDMSLRTTASGAVADIASPEVRIQLRDLLTFHFESDRGEDLKGNALFALWPEHLSAKDLFEVLTPPRVPNSFGAYQSFLISNLISEHLAVEDLPCALNWAQAQELRETYEMGREQLIGALMKKAWENIDREDIRAGLAKLALNSIKKYRPIAYDEFLHEQLGSQAPDADVKRSLLAQEVLQLAMEEGGQFPHLTWSRPPLLFSRDLVWLLDRYLHASDVAAREGLMDVMRECVLRDPAAVPDHFIEGVQSDASLKAKLGHFFVVELGSPIAEQMRREYADQLELQQQRDLSLKNSSSPPPLPPISVRIEGLLHRCETGEPDQFAHLALDLTTDDGDTHYSRVAEFELVALPAWQRSNEATKERIVRSALAYLRMPREDNLEWLGSGTYPGKVIAGVRALSLIAAHTPDKLGGFDSPFWFYWAHCLFACPLLDTLGIPDDRSADYGGPEIPLLAHVYKHAPDELLEVFDVMVNLELDTRQQHPFVAYKVQHLWDHRIAAAFFRWVRVHSLPLNYFRTFLGDLLRRSHTEAIAWAWSHLSTSNLDADSSVTDAIAIAQLLLLHQGLGPWQRIWELIRGHESFGVRLIENLTHAMEHQSQVTFQDLDDAALGELYNWFVNRFPRKDDPWYIGVHRVDSQERMAQWRDAIPRILQQRATFKSVEVLQQLSHRFPHDLLVRDSISKATVAMRTAIWESAPPIAPSTLKGLLTRSDRRLVRSGHELLEVIVEGFEFIERHKFRGKTSQTFCLWDSNSHPKDENDFSNYLKSELDDYLNGRGVIVDREVEIQRSHGEGTGERCDLLVSATNPGAREPENAVIRVVVEVKGCWHGELKTAMENQLVNRYMREYPQCSAGLYLIGWYECKQWTDQDSRFKQWRAYRMSKNEAVAVFMKQADELSSPVRTVRAVVLDVGLR